MPLTGEVASPLRALLETGARVRAQLSTENEREQCILRLESFLAATRDASLLEPVSHTIEDTEQRLTEMFRAAQEAGEFDRSIDPADLARTVHAFTAGIGTLHVAMGDAYPVQRTWDVMVRLFSSLFFVDPSGPAASDGSSASIEPDSQS